MTAAKRMPEGTDVCSVEKPEGVWREDLTYLEFLKLTGQKHGKGRTGIRVAFTGGSTLQPLAGIVCRLLAEEGYDVEVFIGSYEGCVQECLEQESALYRFRPDIVCLVPSPQVISSQTKIASAEALAAETKRSCAHVFGLCLAIEENCSAEVILCNLMLPGEESGGALRREPGSLWNRVKAFNLELSLRCARRVRICDVEFLGARFGTIKAVDPRLWFISKNEFSFDFEIRRGQEVARLILQDRKPPQKLLILDLDGTLWGGVLGEEGIENIRVGSGNPEGEAFLAFQERLRALREQGVLLAICSKNYEETARMALGSHPDMLLREEDFVLIKCGWRPKAEAIAELLTELRVHSQNTVFIDNERAEIEAVRQAFPAMNLILLGDDPALYGRQLANSRFFEQAGVSNEDKRRTEMYHEEQARQVLQRGAATYDAFLRSLEMKARCEHVSAESAPRVAQLINRSNQYNLTMKRCTQKEIESLSADNSVLCLALRLRDRCGDYGMISVLAGKLLDPETMLIDIWVMSCRVFNRGVEQAMLGAAAAEAQKRGVKRLLGIYFSGDKNRFAADHYERLGFSRAGPYQGGVSYCLELGSRGPEPEHIIVEWT